MVPLPKTGALGKRPTTTISTIAIRAGETTKIVVAVLKVCP